MKKEVSLAIRGSQRYQDQDPEVIELMTDGTMEFRNGGWDISYEETELTGMAGVTTTFRVEPGKVTLDRKGALKSRMVFQENVVHESLYQMPFGALMITVCAREVRYEIGEAGGTIDLAYDIEIEQNAAGKIEYHLDIRVKE
jgi:uncharacterized beta-barrel protein YwiB (DUF1934 family)